MHAKRRVGIDDVSIGFIRDSGGNTVGIEGTTQVMEQWGEQRAEFEGSPEADWSITMDDETLSYNGVLSPSVTELPIKYRFFAQPDSSLLVTEDGRLIIVDQKVLVTHNGETFRFTDYAAGIPELTADWGTVNAVAHYDDNSNFWFTVNNVRVTATNIGSQNYTFDPVAVIYE